MKFKKILFVIPLSIMLVGCKKATETTKKTEDNTSSKTTITNTTTEKIKTSTVVFDLNGATGSISSQSVNDGSKVTKPNDPERKGYTFTGWYYNGQLFDFDSPLSFTESITLVRK